MKVRKGENTINEDIDRQPDTLTDLPVAGEREKETKGGPQPFSSASIQVLLGDGSAR
jgi:hypothetical protein